MCTCRNSCKSFYFKALAISQLYCTCTCIYLLLGHQPYPKKRVNCICTVHIYKIMHTPCIHMKIRCAQSKPGKWRTANLPSSAPRMFMYMYTVLAHFTVIIDSSSHLLLNEVCSVHSWRSCFVKFVIRANTPLDYSCTDTIYKRVTIH